MNIIQKKWNQFKSWIRSKLVPEAKDCWKFWSNWAVGIGTTIVGFAPEIHTWLVYLMTQFSILPRSVQYAFDTNIVQFIGLGVIVLSIPLKLFKQSNIDG